MTTLLDEVRLGLQIRDDARARSIAINGRPFAISPSAAEYVKTLAEDQELIDELREFAIAPFDQFSLSFTGPPVNGIGDLEVLVLWANGRYRTILRQDGNAGPIPGWSRWEAGRVRNDAIEQRDDYDEEMAEKLLIHDNLLTAVCLILAQPSSHVIHMGDDRPSRFSRGRMVKFMASSEITLRLDKPAQLRRLFRTGTHASPRRHEVRRHWWHFGGERSCTHVWARESEEGQPLKFRCGCGRIRRERGPFERGDAGKGFVQQRYKVEA